MIQKTYGTMYYVADMKASVNFFKKTLGLTPSMESDDWTEFAVNGHNLCLHGKDNARAISPNGVLIFSLDNIKSQYERMKGDGLNVYGLHEIHPEGWTFHMKDKDQNEFSFYGKP